MKKAFTIVELLVVIMVLAVLVALSLVGYSTISNKARAAAVQVDLQNNATLLKSYQAEFGSYPTALDANNCPSAPTASTKYCLELTTGNALTSYSGATSTYSLALTDTVNGMIYKIDQGGVASAMLQTIAIEGGYTNTCAIATNNNAYCWGRGNSGQLGNNAYINSSIPVAVYTAGVLSGKTIKSISTGEWTTCAIASDDKAYCWGGNWDGALGDGTNNDSSVPVAVYTSGVLSGKTVKAVAAGSDQTCAIASDNNAYCWGFQSSAGQLGNNGNTSSNVPVAVYTSGVLSGKTVSAISAGADHTCVIASDNNAYCWGSNGFGQLGNNSTTNSNVPVAVNTSGVLSGKTIKSIAAGYTHTCAIASDNNVYCWGINAFGSLGNNTTTNSSVPVAVNTSGVLSGKTIKAISSGENYSCAIASDNNAYCWGDGGGKLGNNSTTMSKVPVAVYTAGVLSGKTVLSIAAGGYQGCAVASDNYSYCWGWNYYGALGNGKTTDSSVPVLVSF